MTCTWRPREQRLHILIATPTNEAYNNNSQPNLALKKLYKDKLVYSKSVLQAYNIKDAIGIQIKVADQRLPESTTCLALGS